MFRDRIIAKRLSKIDLSMVGNMFSVAQTPGAINLGIGEPDFTPPTHVINAAKQALDEGRTHYAPSSGVSPLREALAEKAKRDYKLEYDPNDEIIITVGASEAIFLALMAFVDPGDEVLLLDPGFVNYEPDVLLAGGKPVYVSLGKSDGFGLDIEAVMSHITRRSRVIIVNSPNNPTGSVFSHDDLLRLSKLATERDLIVISDEVYEKIVYDGAQHFCLAAFPGMQERTVVVNSLSKTYAMTGLRVGYAVGPTELISAMLQVHQCSVTCVDGAAQYAAIAALEGPQDCIGTMVAEFARRRLLMYSRINKIEGLKCALPQGAFYIFADIRQLEKDSAGFSDYLFSKEKVFVVPGCAFGKTGEGYIRLSYSVAYRQIEEAMDRIEKAVKKL